MFWLNFYLEFSANEASQNPNLAKEAQNNPPQTKNPQNPPPSHPQHQRDTQENYLGWIEENKNQLETLIETLNTPNAVTDHKRALAK